MATPIDISEIQPSQVKSAGWATEATLASLAGHAKGSEDILGKIAAHFKIDIGEARRAGRALEEGNKDRTRGFADLGKKYDVKSDLLAKSIKGLESGLAGALSAKSDDASSPFKVLSSGARSISTAFEKASPVVSAFAGALAIGTGTLAFLINQLSDINDTMRNLYSTGVRVDNGFQGIADAASRAGLSAQQFAEVLGKNSSLTVGVGYRRTAGLMAMFAQATKDGSEFVMTNRESQEAFLETVSQIQRSGDLRNISDDEVTAQSRRYLHNLNDLSAATGRSRDEIRRNAAAMSTNAQVYTAMRQLPAAAQEGFRLAQAGVAASFGNQAETIMEEMARHMTGGVGMMSKEFQMLMATGGGIGEAMTDFSRAISNGTATEEDRAKLVRSIQEFDQDRLRQMALAGRNNPEIAAVHARIVALQDQTRTEYREIQRRSTLSAAERAAEDVTRRAEQAKAAERQEAFNRLNTAMSGFSNTIRSMVADLTPVLIPALEGMASVVTSLSSGLKTVLETISAWTGGGQTGGVVAVATVAAGAILATSVFRAGMGRLMGRMTGGLIGTAAGGRGAGAGASAPGAGIGGLLRGMGVGLRGLSAGLSSLANPAALIGLGAVTLAIMGIATAIRIAGPALEPFGKMIKEVFFGAAEVVRSVGDGIRSVLEGIGTAAIGLGEGIGKALGGVAEVFRGIGDSVKQSLGGVADIFRGLGDSVKQSLGGVADIFRSVGDSIRESFNGVSELVKSIGTAIKDAFAGAGIVVSNMGTSVTEIIDAFAKLRTAGVDATTRQIVELSQIPAGNMISAAEGIRLMRQALEGFTPGLFSGISQGIGSLFTADPSEKLGRLAAVGTILGDSARNILAYGDALKGIISLLDETNMSRFTNLGLVFDRLSNVFRQGINSRQITPLVQAVTALIKGVQEAAPAPAGGGAPVITTDQLNARTILYYEQSMEKFTQISDALQRANEFLDRLVDAADGHARDIVSAIESSGARVR